MGSINSKYSGKASGQPTPQVHFINMEKLYKPPPLHEGGQGSNSNERRIPIPWYENELVPWVEATY